jgi:single-strand DNA-binding protein
MAYDLTGKVKLIQDAQTFGSGFTKREMVVVVEDGKYPQEINLEFVQDKVSLLDNVQVGQEVTVTFDIRGREYNGRYFNNLQGWKIQAGEAAAAPADAEGKPPVSDKDVPADFTEYEDDIPF